jgi:hypothetical protein
MWEKWFKKLEEAIKKWLGGDDNPAPKPDPQPESSDKTEADHGFSHRYPVVASMEFIKVSKSGVYFRAGPRNWKVIKGSDGEFHGWVKRGGKWIEGGKFDHIRPNSTSRDFKNLTPADPYGHWADIGAPKSGEEMAFLAVGYKGTNERTNAIFCIYP